MTEILLIEDHSAIDLFACNDKLQALGISNLTGVILRGSSVYAHFSAINQKLTKANTEKILKVVLEHSYDKRLDTVRRERRPLLAEADVMINKAEDSGEDTSELRKYRQALRDVTNQDLSELKWPEKPWE